MDHSQCDDLDETLGVEGGSLDQDLGTFRAHMLVLLLRQASRIRYAGTVTDVDIDYETLAHDVCGGTRTKTPQARESYGRVAPYGFSFTSRHTRF
jgi:hypothetical protein